MDTDNANRIVKTRLPEKLADWQRKSDLAKTLNDAVEECHRILWDDNQEYREYLQAVWDEDAVEGSLAIDNSKAAEIIRAKAKTLPGNEAAHKKLATIVKCLGVVLRRYHGSRKERRNMVGGEHVPGDNGGE